jgi:transposase
VKPLMPPQKPPTGRPRSDQRRMLAGVLWVLGTGAGWRDLRKRSLARGERSMATTVNGAKKVSGSG